jgi:hypothetical protein
MVELYVHAFVIICGVVLNYLNTGITLPFTFNFFFLPRCSHTWERAPVSEHRADFTKFLNQDGR